MTIEILAWLLVMLELQIGLLVLLIWMFRAGGGFAHVRWAGLTATVYASEYIAGGRKGRIEHKTHGGSLGTVQAWG